VSGGARSGQHWEGAAPEWIDWARAPGHDAFWAYRDALRSFLPPPGRATLEVGCGEGRVARELTELGHTVTATDVAPSLLEAAREVGSARSYVLADAAALPFRTDAFDRVVAYNVLMDVPDMPGSMAEAGRVLAAGGTLTVSLVHPFTDRGRFRGDDPGAPFTITGSYFGREHFSARVTEGSHSMTFDGWSHPLQDYMAALANAGMAITGLREPAPDVDRVPNLAQWTRLPMFLWINAVSLGQPSR
jgi:SAM-dependent methyltransferase